ncbi:MAG TPA: hypothetical protein ENN38_07050 [Actinobacteria bacterium]|nr:hypothetical protein [Actinomycetota bacterium]
MKEGKCSICNKKTEKLWVLNTAIYDDLDLSEQGVRADICERCATDVSEVVNYLKKTSKMPAPTQTKRPVEIKSQYKSAEPTKQENKEPVVKKEKEKPESEFKKYDPRPQLSRGFAQNAFLKELHHNKEKIEILGMDNEVWKGKIEAYDEFSLVIRTKYGKELVFKHAIKSIKPACEEKEVEVFKKLDDSVRSVPPVLPH